ncbi:GTP cyclohydrolase I [Pedobacter sp. P26]|uniref:GTP cyclohydrolase I n=1 Tax=Pedobacter sp. P26 TaxID=3423956 RepID=UPI003D67FF2A
MKEDNLAALFSFIENDKVREKLIGSEHRIRKSFNELFKGYALNAEDVLNDVIHVKDYNGLVKMQNITFYSMCEHHFAPFFGTVDIYYQPDEIITGLGKLVRLAKEVHGARLQIQELMTRDICQDVMRVLKAKGCFVRSSARHLCICSRGPKDDLAETVCTYGEGTLENFIWNNHL